MSTEAILAIVGAVVAVLGFALTLLVVVVGAAIAWGTLRAQVNNNFRAHCELATDLRPKVEKHEEALSNSKANHLTLVERLHGFKEQLDRIEGGMPRALSALNARRKKAA